MKPSIPRGTRDFGPAEMQKRQYIFNILRRNFELFGYEPIETPSMENASTLMGKYGDEGDKLIFKILNSGNYLSEFRDDQHLLETKNKGDQQFTRLISEKALRYDLTVPFARFVVMNQHKLSFPFKRYQIQPVWRADRPQKGRYREFYQCDADVIGSDALLNELELISMIDKSFRELQIPVRLKINNRKILTGIAEKINAPDKIIDITVAIDKLDKIGLEGVNKELLEKGISEDAVKSLQPLFTHSSGQTAQTLSFLATFLAASETGRKGIEELAHLFNHLSSLNLNAGTTVELDMTLARGLNYYTGTIFEVKANSGTFSPSISGGGRYDDLTGIFGLPGMSGVGISFGVDRIYDVMEELDLFPAALAGASSTLLFTHFDTESQYYCLGLATTLRHQGIACEIYPDLTKKLGKQLDYANKKQIPFVCTVGSDEIAKGRFSVKKMSSGEKQELDIHQLIHYLKTESA
jgi:histidyl-tRNA synthetase